MQSLGLSPLATDAAAALRRTGTNVVLRSWRLIMRHQHVLIRLLAHVALARHFPRYLCAL